MKFLVILTIIAICGKTGFALPSNPNNNLKSSGVVCGADDDGNLVKCDELNSKLPGNLNTGDAARTDSFVSIDVKYQTESGSYCIIDDLDNTVECNKRNSILPDDLDDGSARKSDEYICLDITYKTGWILKTTHHVQQCALELSGNNNLCDVLSNKNSVDSCLDTPPYPSPTVEPLSNTFCKLDGKEVQCSRANSRLPDDLGIGYAQESDDYVCLHVIYKTGFWPLQITHDDKQCAHQLTRGDLCDVLRDENSVDACRDWEPESPTTLAPTTSAPTTAAPTTVAPTTDVPTTAAPTTLAPTTSAPTTAAPTTVAPTTDVPTTAAPTTLAPTTSAPTTAAPTTVAPTTDAPTTAAPTTIAPTTAAPTTAAPTTVASTTDAPTTAAPITDAPTTAAPITDAPTTAAPITDAPTTRAPITDAPTTVEPTTSA